MNLWKIYSRFYDQLNSLLPYQNMMLEIAESLKLKNGESIFDAGCGTGNFIQYLLSKYPNISLNITGVDNSDAMLDAARLKFAGIKNISLNRLNLNDIANNDGHLYDKIILLNVYYTLENPEKTLADIYNRLKENGVLIITNPKPENNIFKIYEDQIRLTKAGPLKAFCEFFRFFMIFLINLFIVSRGKKKVFHFYSISEFVKLFERLKIKYFEFQETYSGQTYLIKIKKN